MIRGNLRRRIPISKPTYVLQVSYSKYSYLDPVGLSFRPIRFGYLLCSRGYIGADKFNVQNPPSNPLQSQALEQHTSVGQTLQTGKDFIALYKLPLVIK